MEEFAGLSKRVEQYEYEVRNIEIIKRENEDLKRHASDSVESRRRLAEYESRVSSFKLEI